MKMEISKSSYLSFLTCPKSLYLSLFHPEVGAPLTALDQKRITDGIAVGNLAKKFFKVDVDTSEGLKTVDKRAQVNRTYEALKQNEVRIAEASFRVDGLYCAVDILAKQGNDFHIYEVKASTSMDETYYFDTAFQSYVLRKCGLNVVSSNLVLLDSSYVRHGELDLSSLFRIIPIDKEAKYQLAYDDIPNVLGRLDEELSKAKDASYLGNQCKGCPFYDHCHAHLPSPNVLDINGIRQGHDYLNRGVVTYEDAKKEKRWNKRQEVQIDSYLNHVPLVVDKRAVKKFLDELTYPIYHLDFETFQSPIPPFDETSPYQQIPFQYSLHIQLAPQGETIHKGYLGRKLDCRRELAKSLCNDIPMGAMSMAYNATFEKMVLTYLAKIYPDLAEHLLDIKDHMVDLLLPFKRGDDYRLAMGGSNSIKAVLPACCPNDPELDYHALPVVHNGSEAMEIYPRLVEAKGEEQDNIYHGLWAYCRLDTLAMVKVLNTLYEDCKGE